MSINKGKPDHVAGGLQYFKDGDDWCCTKLDFINLQESPAGFGKTQMEAYVNLQAVLNQRQPIGLRPEWIVLEHRQAEIVEAMERYAIAGQNCPVAWVRELQSINLKLMTVSRKEAAIPFHDCKPPFHPHCRSSVSKERPFGDMGFMLTPEADNICRLSGKGKMVKNVAIVYNRTRQILPLDHGLTYIYIPMAQDECKFVGSTYPDASWRIAFDEA